MTKEYTRLFRPPVNQFICSFFVMLVFCFGSINCAAVSKTVYIRLNQAGYNQNEMKSAVIFSDDELSDEKYSIVDARTGKEVLSGSLVPDRRRLQGFDRLYTADFSRLKASGSYQLKVAGNTSQRFSVGGNIYSAITDSLLRFFSVQRCGYTDPMLHGLCHPDDAVRLIDLNGDTIKTKYDVTGGWHDAADYIKFFNTTAVVTYTLMFSYEFDRAKFGFDNNANNVPDILEEAKVGLDWLMRSNYQNEKFVSQVQDLRDHDQGWRLPESDPLSADRTAFLGMGKNMVGMYVAVMSLASRIWRNDIHYIEFADRCLNEAENIYAIKDKVQDIDKSGTGEYRDNSFLGKMALGAAELYNTTGREELLAEAKNYADKAGSDYWWSWSDVNAFAHYRLAKHEPRFSGYIKNNLIHFNQKKRADAFGRAVENRWGSNNAALGAALQAILYKDLTGDRSFDSLCVLQRDYILGRNPWGISFIYGIGKDYARRLHSQIAYFNNGRLPGALTGGPVTQDIFEKQQIELERVNAYSRFQSSDAFYNDDRMDYLSNEPAILSNATAVFVFGSFKK